MEVTLLLLEIILWLFLIAIVIELFMIVCWFAIMIFFIFKEGWKDIKEIVYERKHRT